MIETLYLLSVILITSIISYEDWKRGIIRNKLIILLLIIGIIYFSYNFPFLMENKSYFLWNIFWSLFIGMFLWFIDIWPSGDAKLFIVLSFLLPSSILLNSQFPSLDLLLNLFVPFFLFFLFYSLLKSKRSDIIDALRLSLNRHSIFTIFIVIVGFIWFIVEGFSFLGVDLNVFAFVIIIFIILEFVNRFSSFYHEIFYIALAVVRLIIDYKNVFTTNFVFQTFSILIIYIFFRFFIIRLTFNMNTRYVKLSDLRPEMRMAEGIEKTKKGKRTFYEKIKLIHFDYVDIMLKKKKSFIHSISDEGVSSDDIKEIQKLRNRGKLKFNRILVHKDIPFALFILVSFVITVLIKTNFIEFIRTLI